MNGLIGFTPLEHVRFFTGLVPDADGLDSTGDDTVVNLQLLTTVAEIPRGADADAANTVSGPVFNKSAPNKTQAMRNALKN